jgi:hypothetical protein
VNAEGVYIKALPSTLIYVPIDTNHHDQKQLDLQTLLPPAGEIDPEMA